MESPYFIKPGQTKTSEISTTFENFKRSFRVRCTFLDYAGLLAAIPKDWKSAISSSNQTATNESLEPSQLARLLLAQRSFCLPLAEAFLKEQKLNPVAVYELPFKITIEINYKASSLCLYIILFPPINAFGKWT